MSLSNYVYTADDGTDYSIGLPTDFADALGMTPATSQPYIDPSISPRYANARDPSGNVRSAVIGTTSAFASIVGSTVTIAGVTWRFYSAQAQSIPMTQTTPLLVAQGPQGPEGPAGPSGSGTSYQYSISTNISLPADVVVSLVDFGSSLDAGTYIFLANCYCRNTGGGGNADFQFAVEDYTTPAFQQLQVSQVQSDIDLQVSLFGVISTTAGHDYHFVCTSGGVPGEILVYPGNQPIVLLQIA